MNRSKRTALAAGIAAIVSLAVATPAHAQATWKPSKPITIIVPWAAGGSTDQVTRMTAAEIEKSLGQKIVVVNQPGASGSIGTKNALEAAKDGYTWTAGAAKDLGTYKVLGMLDTTIQDWALFLNVANVSTLSVNPNSPYKTVNELLDAMRAKPGQISVATAGVNSSGHSAIEAIARQANVKYKHVTYDGGNPAVVATVAGETDATTQLTVEQAEMIRGKRLRPLAVVGDKPVELDGYGTIDPITKSMPQFKEPANYFGIFIPKSRAAAGDRHGREDLERPDQELGGAEEVRDGARRAVRARGRRRCGEGGDARGAGQRVAGVRRRQGEGLARHAAASRGRNRTPRPPSAGASAPARRRPCVAMTSPDHELPPASPRTDAFAALALGAFGVFVALLRQRGFDTSEATVAWADNIATQFAELERTFIKPNSTAPKPVDTSQADQIIGLVASRRSSRVWADEQPANEALVAFAKKMIEAGRWAPNSGDRQPWRFLIMVEKPEKHLLKHVKEQHCYDAPCLIFVGADKRFYGGLGDNEAGLHIDGGAAIMQMVLAAHASHFGVCWNHFSRDLIESRPKNGEIYRNFAAKMQIPDHIEPIAIVAFGQAAFHPPVPPRMAVDSLLLAEPRIGN